MPSSDLRRIEKTCSPLPVGRSRSALAPWERQSRWSGATPLPVTGAARKATEVVPGSCMRASGAVMAVKSVLVSSDCDPTDAAVSERMSV